MIKQIVYGLHLGTSSCRWLLVTRLFSHHQVPATLAYFLWSTRNEAAYHQYLPYVLLSTTSAASSLAFTITRSVHYHQKLFVRFCMLLWPADLTIVIHSYLAYQHVISIDCSLHRIQLLNSSTVFRTATMPLQYHATSFTGFRSCRGLISKWQFLLIWMEQLHSPFRRCAFQRPL